MFDEITCETFYFVWNITKILPTFARITAESLIQTKYKVLASIRVKQIYLLEYNFISSFGLVAILMLC